MNQTSIWLKLLVLGILAISPHFVRAQTSQIILSGYGLSVNGTTEIPEGLLGVHQRFSQSVIDDWGLSSSRIIQPTPGLPGIPGTNGIAKGLKFVVDCWYDRYTPAILVSNPMRWKQILEEASVKYAEAAKGTGYTHHLEFWNEPYLNWATRPAVNYDPRWYNTENASEGQPVYLKGSDQPSKHFVWTKGKWYQPVTQFSDLLSFYTFMGNFNDREKIVNLPIDSTYTRGNRTIRGIESWMPRDTTQKYYYSGMGNGDYYNQMLKLVGEKVKQINPEVKIVGGWGFQMHVNNWYPWKTLFKPMIDSTIHILDGIHEHHYGGEPRIMAANYEVITAYTDQVYNKRLKFYNTETGGQLDPQQPDTPITWNAPINPFSRAVNALTYSLRDILYMMDKCPDKAFSRATHEPHLNDGDAYVFRLLKPLRGQLMQTATSDPDLITAGSLSANKIVLACFNDGRTAKKTKITIHAPEGTNFVDGKITWVDTAYTKNSLEIRYEAIQAQNKTWEQDITIPAKSAKVFVMQLDKYPQKDIKQVNVKQYFSDKILLNNPAGQSQILSISLPQTTLQKAKSARLKFVLNNYKGGGKIKINGYEQNLNYSTGISYQSLDIKQLQAENTLNFIATNTPYDIWMASIELFDAELPLLVHNAPNNETMGDWDAFPNPFNDIIYFKTDYESSRTIQINIFDILGKKVKTLNYQAQTLSGNGYLTWDGKDEYGQQLPNGPYVCHYHSLSRTGKTKIFRSKILKKTL